MGPIPDPYYEPVANYGYSLGDGVMLIKRWQAWTPAAPLGDGDPTDTAAQSSTSSSPTEYRIGLLGGLLAFLAGSVSAALIMRE